MKTYCKKVDILDKEFIRDCVFEFFKGDKVRETKWRRTDFQRLLSNLNQVPVKDIKYAVLVGDRATLREYTNKVADHLHHKIFNLIYKDEPLNLPKFDHFSLHDNLSGKDRRCCKMQPINQVAEYVALCSLQELFHAKIEPYQCASVRGRGQVYGKKAIEKWIRRDKKATKYAKTDVVKCFKTLAVKVVIRLLNKDIRKNPFLIKYVSALLEYYENGMLEIGTVLSASLCNYVLSYVYRYAQSLTYKRRNKNIKIIRHEVFFMDDFLFIGNNERQLDYAVREVSKYMEENLHITLHDWTIEDVRTTPIDMMGFVIAYETTTVRYRIFKRAKRQFIRARNWLNRRIKENKKLNRTDNYLCLRIARKIISYYGYFKHSNSVNIRHKLRIDYIVNQAKKTIGYYMKGDYNVTKSLLYN